MSMPWLQLAEAPELAVDELRRYRRHLVVPEVGVAGQRRLKAARVLLVGAGGLGSPAALYLAAAGVGTLGVVEDDTVDESNLQRQILFGAADLGRPKLEVAAERLAAINPHVAIRPHPLRLTAANALELIAEYDLVVDGSDNFPTRYAVNDACALAGKPLVYGAVLRFEGQLSVFWRPHGPCYRCLFPEPPPAGLVPSCAEAGVLGVLPGIVGSLQAAEAIKLILGQGSPLIGRYLVIDALGGTFRELGLPRDPECALCGEHPTITAPVAYEEACGPSAEATAPLSADPLASSDAVALDPERDEIGVEELAEWRRRGVRHLLLDVREPFEEAIARIEGSLLVPLREVPARLDEVPNDRPLVVFCHLGGRSANAVGFLRSRGLQALNLVGGIEAWSCEIDPAVPRY